MEILIFKITKNKSKYKARIAESKEFPRRNLCDPKTQEKLAYIR
jgi:hypothetical protein